jgi:hypothetical protein
MTEDRKIVDRKIVDRTTGSPRAVDRKIVG